MKVKDIEARRAEIGPNVCGVADLALKDLYSDVLTAIAKSGIYPPAAQAKAALGLPTNTKRGKK